jgi:hypothetical protein
LLDLLCDPVLDWADVEIDIAGIYTTAEAADVLLC